MPDDPHALRGRWHRLVVILVLVPCATLVVGSDSMAAIWQWATDTRQEVLVRIGAGPLRRVDRPVGCFWSRRSSADSLLAVPGVAPAAMSAWRNHLNNVIG